MKKWIAILLLLSPLAMTKAQETLRFSLEEAIAYAMENNYTVRNAQLDIETAEEQKREATSFGLPQVDGAVDYQNFLKQAVTLIPAEIIGGNPGDYEEVVFGAKQNMAATVTLNQLIFDGSYIVGLQSAKTFLKISNLAKEKTDQTIREAVINAYGNVLISQETIKIFEDNRDVLQKNLDETKILLETGFAEEQDYEQQQITLLLVINELNKASRLELIAQQMLNLTLGIPIETPVLLTDSLENLAIRSTDLNILSTQFNLENHIDYKIIDNKVMTDELQVKYEKTKYYPSINAFVNYSKFANNDNFVFFENAGNWFDSSLLGVSLNIPIFSSNQRNARTQQAKINLMQSEIDRDELSQQLQLEVTTAKNKYQFALDQYQTNRQNLSLAESIAEKEQIKFFEGLSSSINLTNVQNQLFRTQQDYLQSILEIISTKVELENALNQF